MEVKILTEEIFMADMVNHPAHYNQGKREVIEEMRILFGDLAVAEFCRLSAYKYIRRADYKGHKEEDLKKAEWYMDYVDRLTGIIDDDDFEDDDDFLKYTFEMPHGKSIDVDAIEELTKKIDKMQAELAKYKLDEDRDPNLEA